MEITHCEAGVATNDRFYVVGTIKMRRHDEFARAVRDIRDRTDSTTSSSSVVFPMEAPRLFDLVDLLCTPSVHLAACIVDREAFGPSELWKPKWRAPALAGRAR